MRPPTLKNVFSTFGLVLLSFLCVLPIWNAAALLMNENFLYFVGAWWAIGLIFTCVAIVAFYVVSMSAFFNRARIQVGSGQAVLISTVFVLLLGLMLILFSLHVRRTGNNVASTLVQRCENSPETRRLHEYSQVLLNIRNLPGCQNKSSIEDCVGYRASNPYTEYLKIMENTFHCTGFCVNSYGSLVDVPDPVELDIVEGAAAYSSTTTTTTTTSFVTCGAETPAQCNSTLITSNRIWFSGCSSCNTQCACSFNWASYSYSSYGTCICKAQTLSLLSEPTGGDAPSTDGGGPMMGLVQRPLTTDAARPAYSLLGRALSSSSSAGAQGRKALVMASGRLEESVTAASAGSVTSRALVFSMGVAPVYPPTLFSNNNYQGWCSLDAARNLKTLSSGLAEENFNLGVLLASLSIILAFFSVCGFFFFRKDMET